MNISVISGRLTADPELRTTPTGLSVTSFTVAVNRRFKNSDGGYDADFIDAVAWRGTADFVCKYFKKGDMIELSGSIQTRMYETKDGGKRKATEIVADNVGFCGGKSDKPKASVDVDDWADQEVADLPWE